MALLDSGADKRRSPSVRELAFWLGAGLAFAAWLVWGPPQIMRGLDYALMHHFMKAHLRAAFWAHEMPFWNPYSLLGRPFLADPEVAAFYPATWLFLFLPESIAFWLTIGLHFAIGGGSFSRLAHYWGIPMSAAAVGGVAFAASPSLLGPLHCGCLGFFCTIAWWPLLLRFADQLCEGPRARHLLILAALLAACFLAGHPHAFWLCGCSLGIYLLPRCCSGGVGPSLRRAARAYGGLALAALGALALCAIQFLPLIELAHESNRTPGREFAAAICLSFEGLLSLWRPTPSEPVWLGLELYTGLPMVALGSIQLARLGDIRMRSLFCLAVVALLLALGQQTPFFDWLYPLIPAMGFFRCNNRFATFAVWAVLLAAVSFWRRRDDAVSTCWSDAALVAIGLFVLATRGIALPLEWAAAAAVVGGILIYRASTRARSPRPLLVFGVWVVAWIADFVPPTAEFGRLLQAYSPGPHTTRSDFPIEVRDKINPAHELAPTRLLVPNHILKANSGMVNGYSFVTGYGALTSARVWDYLHGVAGVPKNDLLNTFPSPDIHSRSGPFPYKGADIQVSWDTAQQTLVLRPEGELGARTWLGRNLIEAPSREAAIRLLRDGTDPRSATLIEPDAWPSVAAVQSAAGSGSAEIAAFSRNRVALRVSTDTPSVLVLAEAWYPGWQAEIDGTKTEVFPVNVWMRGAVVPAGAKSVVFVYNPSAFWIGAAISALALVTWIAAWRQYRTQQNEPVDKVFHARSNQSIGAEPPIDPAGTVPVSTSGTSGSDVSRAISHSRTGLARRARNQGDCGI